MLRPVEPADPLKPFVLKYVQLEVPAAELWPVPARSVTCIEFTFGEPYRLHRLDGFPVETSHPAILIGAKTHSRIQLESRGRVDNFAIFFQPTGLQRLFSLPGNLIVDEHYEASTVLGATMRSLHLQLAEAESFSKRVEIVNSYFIQRIPRVIGPCMVDAAVREIVCRQGCIRIPEVARHTGIGLRQFERRFVHDLGISPKLYARIVRFEGAMQKRALFPSLNWTEIAHQLEYHDQMHMVHDFRSLSGESPTSLGPYIELLSTPAKQTSQMFTPKSIQK
jgi:AraC-like DNA-binding protein